MNLFTALHVYLYRMSGGKIGGRFRGAPVLLLTTTGRKTGKHRTTPLLYFEDSDNLVLVASNGGRDLNPSWWSNLTKNPEAQIQIRNDARVVKARKASVEEKARLWPIITKMSPFYNNYQKKTKREIPVVMLESNAA